MAKTNFINSVFYKSSEEMSELPDASVQLVVTSPPYFNIKNYSKDGHQRYQHSDPQKNDIGRINDYKTYLSQLLNVWRECERVLQPNGKLCINVPLMPIPKRVMTTHYNRHIFDLQSGIQQTILENTNMFLMDIYIWNRSNSSKSIMFGSYPYPPNFYAQNTTEFISVYVKDGKPINKIPLEKKHASKLTQEEWIKYTRQIWDIPIPNQSDPAFGLHPAIMPDEITKRCIRLFSFVGDLVLDPFAGSGTTLRMAKILERGYVGYEIYPAYRKIIERKLSAPIQNDFLSEAVNQ